MQIPLMELYPSPQPKAFQCAYDESTVDYDIKYMNIIERIFECFEHLTMDLDEDIDFDPFINIRLVYVPDIFTSGHMQNTKVVLLFEVGIKNLSKYIL